MTLLVCNIIVDKYMYIHFATVVTVPVVQVSLQINLCQRALTEYRLFAYHINNLHNKKKKNLLFQLAALLFLD